EWRTTPLVAATLTRGSCAAHSRRTGQLRQEETFILPRFIARACSIPSSSTPPSSGPRPENLASRVVPYSNTGNVWPHPELITISFMPDGTNLGGVTSNLVSKFNARFGSASAWQNQVLKAAQQWAAQTNINFRLVTDSGAASGSGSYEQG